MIRALSGLFAAVLLAMPSTAFACAVCFSATEGSRLAFIITTVFLTVVPLIVIGSGARWLWRREQEIAAGEAGEPASAL